MKLTTYNINLVPIFKDMLLADEIRFGVRTLIATAYGTELGDKVEEYLDTIVDGELLRMTGPQNKMEDKDVE